MYTVSNLESDDVKIVVLEVLRDLGLITAEELDKVAFATDLKDKYIEDNSAKYQVAAQL